MEEIYIYTNYSNESVLIRTTDILIADKIYKNTTGIDPFKTIVNISKKLNTLKEVTYEQNESYINKHGKRVENIVSMKKYVPCDTGEYVYVCGEYKLIKDIRVITLEENLM